LASSGGLADTGDAARFATVQSALRQTQHELFRMAKLSQDVLPMIVFNQSFGALVNVATTWMVERLQELWDVSEEETHRLFTLFTSLDKLEDVFTDPTVCESEKFFPFFFVLFPYAWNRRLLLRSMCRRGPK
jgi:hypothetical protein